MNPMTQFCHKTRFVSAPFSFTVRPIVAEVKLLQVGELADRVGQRHQFIVKEDQRLQAGELTNLIRDFENAPAR